MTPAPWTRDGQIVSEREKKERAREREYEVKGRKERKKKRRTKVFKSIREIGVSHGDPKR